MPENTRCLVRQTDGDIYEFHRRGSSLYMTLLPAGDDERVTSYRDAVWKMGDNASSSAPAGPPSFIAAWKRAVPVVFDWMTAGEPWTPKTNDPA